MKDTTDPYLRAMFGVNAVQVPFNCILQPNHDSQTVLAVVLIQGPEAMRLTYGSKAPHVLIMGDAVVRPRCVVESSHLVGEGISSIARSGFANVGEWARHGKVILGRDAIPVPV